jgi:Na+/melibiose symporter-like transporter
VNCAQVVLLLPLLAFDRPGRLWIAVVVAVAESSLARVAGPAGFALLPAVVEPAGLARANGLLGMADAAARLGGAPLGGVLYAVGGLPLVVGLDAATFAAAALLAAAIRVPTAPAAPAAPEAVRPMPAEPAEFAGAAEFAEPAEFARAAEFAEPAEFAGAAQVAAAEPARAGLLASWLDGLRIVARNRTIATVLGANALGQLAQGLFLVLFVLFVERSLHGGGGEVGLLRGLQAVGSVGGGLWLGRHAARLRPAGLFGWSLVVLGLLSAAQWNLPVVSTWTGWYALTFALSGLPAVTLGASAVTLAQAEVRPSHLGRVAGLFDSSSAACVGLGVLLAGLLGEVVPLTGLLDAQAALLVAAGLLSLTRLGAAVRPAPAVPARAQSLTG